MKKIIFTPKAPQAIGPYSQAVEVNDTLYISGQVPLDPETMKVVEGGIKEILNFAPFSLRAPEDVEIRYADLALELQNLSYTLKNRK